MVAQPVEQRTENPCVGGSIPSRGTIKKGQLYAGLFYGFPIGFIDWEFYSS